MEGVRLVQRALAGALERRGSRRSRRTGAFDPHVHEALLAQPRRREHGSVLEVVQKGYRLGDQVLRPARVVVAGVGAMADPCTRRSAFHERRPTTRSRRRTASLRASSTPTATRRRVGRGALQGRPDARTTCSPTPRSASSTTPSASPARGLSGGFAGRRERPCRERRPRRPLGSVRRHGWHRRHLRPRPARAGAT